jgi:drug/metabolite transporter (DMT)-like permease
MQNYYGELAALFTAFMWTVSSMAFEAAGKRIGSLSLNILRLLMALLFISAMNYFSRGLVLATDADAYTWFWLAISGLVGFVIGDLLLFQAFIVIGARITMLVMSLAPPITALIGWMLLGETLTFKQILAMTVTVSGIIMVMIFRKNNDKGVKYGKRSISVAFAGFLLALGGTIGQAAGLVLSKKGMGDYDPFAATQIRIIAGIAGFALLITILNRWKRVIVATKNIPAVKSMALGSFAGPFLGVSFSLIAVKYTETGIAATIMAIVPVIIIIPAIVISKEKISLMEILGAIIAVIGVGLFFL